MRSFLARIKSRLGKGLSGGMSAARPDDGATVREKSTLENATPASGDKPANADGHIPEFITAQDYYRRDGQHDDGRPKWQLRHCMAVRIRDDMWQIREIHTALHAPPQNVHAPGKTAHNPPDSVAEMPGEVIANTITDMVDCLEDALARLADFEAALEAEDWLPSAAEPAYPTRAEISALLDAPVADAAE